MTHSKARRAGAVALFAIGLLSTQLSAAPPRRRVASPPAADVLVTITGTVVDAATGAPVFTAQLVNEGRTVTADANGRFTLKVPANRNTSITAQRWGYNSTSRDVKVSGGETLEFRLDPKATITLRETDGSTHTLDYESSQFAYLIPFSGYAKYDTANLCRPDGTKWEPSREEFKRIVGPATSTTYSACCTLGPVLQADVEMKSGEKTRVYFNDSCFGNEIDFVSRDRATGQFVYYNFAKVAEIVFP